MKEEIGVFIQNTGSVLEQKNKKHIAFNGKKNDPSIITYILGNKSLYLMTLPGLVYLFIFNYIPMYGVLIAFKDFDVIKGIWGSSWVGLNHFHTLFTAPDFYNILKNSLLISFYRLVWGFPAPIIVALMLNEIHHNSFKRITQSLLYLPHFISWVVISGIVYNFLSPAGGALNIIIEAFGGQPVAFLQKPEWFRSIIVVSDIWKELGWGTIIYIAALTGIPGELYEAAIIDGASRLQRMFYITLPGIASTVIVLLTLRMGSILKNGFEQIFLLYNPMVFDVADVLETYTYRVGLLEGNFSFSTAVGIFSSVVGFVLIHLANKLAKRMGEGGLW